MGVIALKFGKNSSFFISGISESPHHNVEFTGHFSNEQYSRSTLFLRFLNARFSPQNRRSHSKASIFSFNRGNLSQFDDYI